MTIPPKALTVLVDLKRELLLREESPPKSDTAESYTRESHTLEVAGLRAEPEHRTPERQMRHARRRNSHFQTMCRRREYRF